MSTIWQRILDYLFDGDCLCFQYKNREDLLLPGIEPNALNSARLCGLWSSNYPELFGDFGADEYDSLVPYYYELSALGNPVGDISLCHVEGSVDLNGSENTISGTLSRFGGVGSSGYGIYMKSKLDGSDMNRCGYSYLLLNTSGNHLVSLSYDEYCGSTANWLFDADYRYIISTGSTGYIILSNKNIDLNTIFVSPISDSSKTYDCEKLRYCTSSSEIKTMHSLGGDAVPVTVTYSPHEIGPDVTFATVHVTYSLSNDYASSYDLVYLQ